MRKVFEYLLFATGMTLMVLGLYYMIFHGRYFRGTLALCSSAIITLEGFAIKNTKSEIILKDLMNNPFMHIGVIFQILGVTRDSMTFWLSGILVTFFAMKKIGKTE